MNRRRDQLAPERRPGVLTRWLAACLPLALPVRAATPVAANTLPVELPPMLVEESVSTAPWYYAAVPGAEFLSRCSAGTTREFIAAWQERMQLVQAIVPPEMLARFATPEIIVLYAQDLEQTVSAEIERELRGPDGTGAARANIAPNMRLADRDMHASIVYLDEAQFNAAGLSIAPGHVRFLLKNRQPEPPAWLVEGVARAWRQADFVQDPVTFRPLVWINSAESDALAGDPAHPRALLPAAELFATAAQRALENQHPRRREIREAQQELFFRWALTNGAATREAMWRFAALAATAPPTEDQFRSCFGFGYAELRDRLSDFLPRAVRRDQHHDPGSRARLPRVEVGPATPGQIARLRGEWERLAIWHVQRRLPQAREPYIAQARRTLRRAYAAGDRDPRLLATMGLCEIEAGQEAGARAFLEPAVNAGVARPSAGYELARLRFAELRSTAPAGRRFSPAELAPVVTPLRRALAQSPALPEVVELLSEVLLSGTEAPTAEELAELAAGVRFFPRQPAVVYAVARVLARHGQKSAAVAMLQVCDTPAPDETLRTALAQLRAELSNVPTQE